MSDTIQSKRCSTCKQIKPVSEFSKNRSRKDGHHNQCKQCCQNYYQAHRTEQLQYSKEYAQAHRAERLQNDKKYRQAHQDEISRRRKKYHQAHRVERSQYNKEYYQAHRTKRLEYHKKYRNTLQGHLRCVWRDMHQRCNNPKNKRYKDYGGRGIKVKFACFNNFFDYVKELKAKPRGLTIDRIDNDGHYEPGNIRFVTITENLQNKRHKYQTKFS